MKVMVTLAVEVDKAAWVAGYGAGITSKEIVGEVRRYAVNQMAQSAAAQEGCFTSVEVR